MTLMLASVTGAEEATIAVRHGADIIDVKDVRLAFGSATPALARTIRRFGCAVPARSVRFVGEPEAQPTALAHAAAIADAGASYVKTCCFRKRPRRIACAP
jgi:uncharacterized protein (UPF0264 family)